MDARGFWQKVDKSDPSGCWIWTGAVTVYGYGAVRFDGTTRAAHRVAWFLTTGEWPAQSLDHLCHNADRTCVGGDVCRHRRCVNPEHLEDVWVGENRRRAPIAGWAKIHAAKDTCPRGHRYDGRNARQRTCSACHSERNKAYIQRRRQNIRPEDHGRENTYVQLACRCTPCREAMNAARARRAQKE